MSNPFSEFYRTHDEEQSILTRYLMNSTVQAEHPWNWRVPIAASWAYHRYATAPEATRPFLQTHAIDIRRLRVRELQALRFLVIHEEP